jgi:hypothetical protein
MGSRGIFRVSRMLASNAETRRNQKKKGLIDAGTEFDRRRLFAFTREIKSLRAGWMS